MTNPLEAWLYRVADELGIDPSALDQDLLLDLTRDVAHGVSRPAAPLTAFLVGLSAGLEGGTHDTVQMAVEDVRRILARHPQP
ncbi:MAG: DUF6457 domain-containing protein [Jatrophihabitans sp.]|uniref:DUF6457 domain-containing protein n=1 Tax=Jatrophihabitans sp. TaxID=1932789 RepID=UPI003F7CEB8E